MESLTMRASGYHFDRWGSYLGYVDRVGHYFDRNGTYRGAVSESGTFYDEHAVYRGRFDIQGQYYDEHGMYRGYLLRLLGSQVPGSAAQTTQTGDTSATASPLDTALTPRRGPLRKSSAVR
jgi:hypothetical protein